MSAILKITAIIGLLLVSHVASAQTTFCIVYSPSESVARRIITPDHDSECNDPILLTQGEAVLILPLKQRTGDKNVANALVAQATSIPTTTDNCAFIDGPLPNSIFLKANPAPIAGTFLCDPTIDGPPSNESIVGLDPAVAPGDLWNGTQFLRNYAVINPATCTVVQTATLALDNPVSPVPGDTMVGNAAGVLTTGQILPNGHGCTVAVQAPSSGVQP